MIRPDEFTSQIIFRIYYKYHKIRFKIMGKLGIIKEVFELLIHKRKFHMFPIIILLIALIGVTALTQTGLVAFIYPI